MGTVSFQGEIEARPQIVSDTTFPGGRTDISLILTPTAKQAGVMTGVALRTISSPLAYVALTGVGASDTVTQANFLYLRTNAPMLVRLTFEDGANPDIVAIVPVFGVFVYEVDVSRYLKLVEVLGSGQVEWFASGPQ